MRTWAVVMMVVVGCWWTTTEAQSTDCVGSLTACLSPLKNSTETPSLSCCLPLKEAVANQKPCLCNLLNNPETLKTFNITTNQIFSLAARCKIADATPSMCTAAPSSPPTGTVTPPPPGTKAGTANVVTWTRVSLTLSIMASVLFF